MRRAVSKEHRDGKKKNVTSLLEQASEREREDLVEMEEVWSTTVQSATARITLGSRRGRCGLMGGKRQSNRTGHQVIMVPKYCAQGNVG